MTKNPPPCEFSQDGVAFLMEHLWDIIKNVPSAVSVEVRDKVGIYQIVSLVWRGERAEKGM